LSDKGDSTIAGLASIVVRTRDEARHLRRLLEDSRRQTHKAIEVIVVDSGSRDGTLEIAHELADRVIEIAPESFTFGRSLNEGCRVARGEFLIFVSAHAYPASNNWLRNLLAPLADPGVAMVYGRQLPWEGTRLDEERDLIQNFGERTRVSVDDPIGPNNANAAIRAASWREMPFNEDLSGFEDSDWAKRAQAHGMAVYYAHNAAIVHIHDESLRQIFRRFRREGKALSTIFPEQGLTLAGAIKRWVVSCLRDLAYGARRGAWRRLPPVPAARAAEFAGLWRGYRDDDARRRAQARAAASARIAERAVVIEAPGRHGMRERPAPSPGADEVVVRVAYTGVCRTDLDVLDGELDYYRTGAGRFPIVPGHEYSGIVGDLGESVSKDLKIGDRVVGECILGCGVCASCTAGLPAECPNRRETGVLNKDGAYATRLVLPAASVHRVPHGTSLRSAALTEPVAVAVKAVRLLEVAPGEQTCVVGGGPIGQLAAQTLRAQGAQVTLIDRDEKRLRLAAELDISTASRIECPELSHAGAIIEATGNADVLPPLVAGAHREARICLVGLPHRPLSELAPDVNPNGRRVFGSLGSDPRDWPVALELIASGRIELGALTASVEPLESYQRAWERCRRGERIKQLLLVDPRLAEL